MKLFRFLKSKTFAANLVVALIFLGLVIYGIQSFLHSYTRHGEVVRVPDLKRMSLTEVENELEKLGLEYSVLDSAEFDPDFPRGSVLAHYPPAEATVKEKREIKLTLNPLAPKQVEIPEIVEKTKRRAIYDLESKGLRVGELIYEPYIGKDVVLRMEMSGEEIEPGTKVKKGSVIDVVLGAGLSDQRVPVPHLHWMSLEAARSKAQSSSLNIGAVVYDDDTRDSTEALVYRQYPQPTMSPSIRMGQEIDLWLTEDHTKIPGDSLEVMYRSMNDTGSGMVPDSLNIFKDSVSR